MENQDIIEYLEKNKNIFLNEQQKNAVENINGNILLLAVPGAGKTTVMCARIANLIYNKNVSPQSILNLTFSRASATDMQRRFSALFSDFGGERPKFSTIHSFCFTVVRMYSSIKNSKIPDLIEGGNTDNKKINILREIYKNINREFLSEDIGDDLSNQISYIKNMMLSDDEINEMTSSCTNLLSIYKKYEEVKRKNGLMDFDDMLTFCHTILKKYPQILAYIRNRYTYFCVDEAQDTSKLQHSIMRLACGGKNMFMVGDEDQSIYSFRGAYPQALLGFSKLYPEATVLKMEENFRSSAEIVTAANRFISYNTDRYPKNMHTHREAGEKIKVDKLYNLSEQYNYIAKYLSKLGENETVGVIYRNNYSCLPFLDILEKNEVDFQIREHSSSFKNNLVVADILRFLAYSKNKGDYGLFSRIFYKCNTYLKRDVVNAMKLDSVPCTDFMREVAFVADNNPDIKVSASTLLYVSNTIDKLKTQPVQNAIDTIIDDLGYLDYLRHIGSYSYVNVQLQKITVLKAIAKQCSTIEDLLEKLDSYNNIINRHSGKSSNITLTTAHSAKGLEFDRVIIVDSIDGVFPTLASIDLSSQGEKSLVEEEARLFYVAATRARNSLTIITSENSDGESVTPSRFIARLLEEKEEGSDENVGKRLLTGQRINHFIFGNGQIIGVDRNNKTVSVFFVANGTRSLTMDIFTTNKVTFL